MKLLAILGTGALLAIVASAILIYGIRQADTHLQRASTAQNQLEYLMLLSGRITDYGLASIISLQSPGKDGLAHGRTGVMAVFDELSRAIARDVSLQSTPDSKSAAATKSLSLARLRAQFDVLNRQLVGLETTAGDVAEKTATARGYLAAFGVRFAPMLAQAIEDGRHDAEAARADMFALRNQLTIFAVVWGLVAAVGAALLYRLAALPTLRRIEQAGLATSAISRGELDTRLTAEGHDEMTLLMARFNRMAQKLSRREHRVAVAQAELEDTIAEKTRELQSAYLRLEEIDSNRRRFFSDVSHELRTPLTVILGEAEVTLRQKNTRVPRAVKTALGVIVTRAQSLRRRVDDLLRIARSESGELGLNFADVDLNAIAHEAVAETQDLARQRELTLMHAGNASPLMVSGDHEWLRQVLSGLIANAIKYSAPGQVISIALQEHDGDAVAEISDQGSGIASADLPHVFERFYRGEQDGHAHIVGHGIGLALAKWIVESHKGTIEVVSPSPVATEEEPGVDTGPGTLVRLKVPALKPRSAEEAES